MNAEQKKAMDINSYLMKQGWVAERQGSGLNETVQYTNLTFPSYYVRLSLSGRGTAEAPACVWMVCDNQATIKRTGTDLDALTKALDQVKGGL